MLVFQPAHGQETLVPTSLKLCRDEAIMGVDSVVLPPRTSRFVARLLGEFDLALLLALLGPARLHGPDRRLNAERLNALDHFGADRTINPHAAERDARLAAVIEVCRRPGGRYLTPPPPPEAPGPPAAAKRARSTHRLITDPAARGILLR